MSARMTNAAILLHPNGFDTSGATLLGRHSAGESFLRGLMRHGDVERFRFWNYAGSSQADLDTLIARIGAPSRPISWIANADRRLLNDPGVVYVPSPEIDAEAWQRRTLGSHHYSICGVTHTTATARVMRVLTDLMVAPVESHDALICTSTAVRAAVEVQLGQMRDYMAEAYGPRRRGEPMRVTIPLGVNADDFQITPEHRSAWRERLSIPDDAVVALYVGRFNVRGKMNPGLMAMALERAARRTKKEVYWVNSGWAGSAKEEETFHAETRKLCPSVHYVSVDGRKPDTRFTIWSVADLFISFSDNIQETFGLTPVEAMAAGLPSVVSDWDGYKDTVRHGVDGYRIPTLAPAPGYGGDMAYWFANGWMNYDNYIGAAGQCTAVDLAEAEAALLALIENPDLRASLGANARERARQVFDWAAVIPQYQALWAEQNARRQVAPQDAGRRPSPLHIDPYTLFADYPTRHLTKQDIVTLEPEMTWPLAQARLDQPLAVYSRFNRPNAQELALVIGRLSGGPAAVAELLELIPAPRRNYMERGLIWLARHDVVSIRPAG